MSSQEPTQGDKKVTLGFVGEQRVITPQLSPGDIAPYSYEDLGKFKLIGTDVDRVDAKAKVTGRAKYAYDINLPGLLYGVVLRSPHAKGAVKSVEIEAARAMPGVKAVIALKKAGNKLRYVGDEIAAVAAGTLDEARDALEKIRVAYEVAEHNTDPMKSAGAPELDAKGHVASAWPEDERIAAGLKEAEYSTDATYRCAVQTHSALETHGATVRWNDDGTLELWASTQATFGTRSGVAAALQIPQDKVLVHTEFMGGGFGAKLSPGTEPLAAARLAKEAKAPVKLMLDRYEEHTVVGNRPGALIQIRAGVKKDGTITAFDYRSWGEPGYGGGGGTTPPRCYFQKKPTRSAHKDLPTDMDAGRAMRAPGHPQGHFAAESMLDELARGIKMDALELRAKNDQDVVRQHEWKLGAERFQWASKVNPSPGKPKAGADPRHLRGAGCASAMWGGLGGPGGRVLCRIHKDGRVEARNGAQDIGTGMKTVLATLTAEELGIPMSQVTAHMGDTRDPQGPGSGGSTTTPSLAPAARLAAALARKQLEAIVAEHLNVANEQVRCADGKVGTKEKQLAFTDACKLMTVPSIEAVGERFRNYETFKGGVFGAQFAEVEVDTHTGLVRVLSMAAVQDCGVVVSKKTAESQVMGAMIQGISYALHEQRIVDHKAGRMVNGDFLNYKLTGSEDMPSMDVVMLSVANGGNNVGACGVGEPAAVAPAAAIANAVANAIGVPVRSLPITPDKVLKALAERKGV